MNSRLNPFPDYAVTRLSVEHEARVPTVVTTTIANARKLVDAYIQGMATPNSTTGTSAALCAVRGDYGTGKTHLLNDVAAYLQEKCKDARTKPSIVRATCIEANALFWYQTKLGPQLDTLPLDDIALELYGRAGQKVAGRAVLTESAVGVLEEDPKVIRDLIRANRLSIDEVTREYLEQLASICKAFDETVRGVLAGLVSSETEVVARAWIRGEKLSDHSAELLRAPTAIASSEQASAVIGAIAAMHKAVGRPFLVLVDEFEHFVRYDTAHGGSSANATWLKRLLEQLGNAGAVALVAGHWSAWTTAKDYLDRFPQYAPIDLVKLETDDVMQLLTGLLGKSARINASQAQVIAAVTGGNMRRVMSLCNLLFRQSDGFTTELTEKRIHEAWTLVAQRISQEQALEQIVDMLVPRGFEVKTTDAVFHSIPFDLVAERKDGRVVLVQAKHSADQSAHYDAAQQFLIKLTRVVGYAPSVVGMFLANGSIDDELLGILKGSGIPNLRWFDLTDRDVLEKIRADIAAMDGQPSSTPWSAAPPAPNAASAPNPVSVAAIQAESAKLREMNAELERKLRELDERRGRETQALKERLDLIASESRSPRLDSVRGETQINPERAHTSYEAMLEEPSINKKLRYLGTSLMLGLAWIVLGLYALVARDHIAEAFAPTVLVAQVAVAILVLLGISLFVAGAWLIWRRYSQVADYFDFARQIIRDLYVREVPIVVLSRVNRILRRAIAQFGARRARYEVIGELRSSDSDLPVAVRNYLSEIWR